jgi:hypothetical protein
MSGKPVAEQEIGFIAGSSSPRNFNVKEKILPIILVRNLTVKQVKVLIWTIRNQK